MKAEINVTPLVDIVLVLLIIFIVITPAVNDAVRLPLARGGSAPEPGGRRLVLALVAHRDAAGKVDGPGRVRVDVQAAGMDPSAAEPSYSMADPAARARLAEQVRSARARWRDLRIFIKADLDLPFRQVDDLLQLCREAGAPEAGLVTREDAAGKG